MAGVSRGFKLLGRLRWWEQGGSIKLVRRDGRTLANAGYLYVESGYPQMPTWHYTLRGRFGVFLVSPSFNNKHYVAHAVTRNTLFNLLSARCPLDYLVRYRCPCYAIRTRRVGNANDRPGDTLLRGPLEQADVVGPADYVLRGDERHRVGAARHS